MRNNQLIYYVQVNEVMEVLVQIGLAILIVCHVLYHGIVSNQTIRNNVKLYVKIKHLFKLHYPETMEKNTDTKTKLLTSASKGKETIYTSILSESSPYFAPT